MHRRAAQSKATEANSTSTEGTQEDPSGVRKRKTLKRPCHEYKQGYPEGKKGWWPDTTMRARAALQGIMQQAEQKTDERRENNDHEARR